MLSGINFTSAFKVENNTPIFKNQVRDDCWCDETEYTDIVKLEKQLNRLERYGNKLYILFKVNSEIKHICENLLNNIESIILWDFPIICYLFLECFIDLSDLIFYFVNMIQKGIIYVILFGITLTIGVLINWFMVELGCENLLYI